MLHNYTEKPVTLSTVLILAALVLSAAALGAFTGLLPSPWAVIFIMIGVLIVGLIFRFPEFGLALYLFTSTWKEAPVINTVDSRISTLVVLVLLIVLSLVYQLSVKQAGQRLAPKQKQNRAILSLILFCGYLLSNALVFSDANGLERAVRFSIFSLAVYFILATLFSDKERLQKFIIWSFGLGLILCTIAVLNVLLLGTFSTYRGAGAFEENYINAGRTAGITLILAVATMLAVKGQSLRFILIIGMLVSLAASIISYSRGAIVGILVTVFYLFWATGQLNNLKRLARIGLLVVVGAAVTIILFSRFDFLSYSRFLWWNDTSGANISTGVRFGFYDTAVVRFLEHPVVGIGVSNFEAIDDYSGRIVRTYPHNIVLEVLAELGIIGGFLFFPAVVYTFALANKLIRQVRTTMQETECVIVYALAGGFVFFLAVAMFSGSIEINRYIWLFAFGLWIFDKIVNKTNARSSETPNAYRASY